MYNLHTWTVFTGCHFLISFLKACNDVSFLNSLRAIFKIFGTRNEILSVPQKTSYVWSCDTFGLKSLIKDAASYKNPENPCSIDLILTNNPRSFQNSCVIETGLSGFHRMVVTVIKTLFERLKTRVINYRDKLFRAGLLFELSNSFLEENEDCLEEFIEICQKTLNHHPHPNKSLYGTIICHL